MIARVDVLVAAMRESPDLQALCFDMASEGVGSCGDRVALALSDMEMAHIDQQARSGQLSTIDVLKIGDGMFKRAILDDVAVEKIAEREEAYRLGEIRYEPDPIEIRLAYHTALAQTLSLPGVAQEMLYERTADLSEQDVADARDKVLTKLERTESVDFLVQWSPWRQAMERKYPEDFRQAKDLMQVARDQLALQPPRMSEQNWLDALDAQAATETTLYDAVAARVTRQFIEEMQPAEDSTRRSEL